MLQRITALILIPTFLCAALSFIKIATCSSFHVYNFSTLLALFSTISAEIFDNQDTSLSFFFACASFQIIFAFFVLLALVIHIVEGLENVFHDYLHNVYLKRYLFSFLTCFKFVVFKALVIYTIFCFA